MRTVMHELYQMTKNEDGEPFPHGKNWHIGGISSEASSLFCTGEYFDQEGSLDAEGYAKCRSKNVAKGGITCPECLEAVKTIQSIKL
jgi:hypothetical protein